MGKFSRDAPFSPATFYSIVKIQCWFDLAFRGPDLGPILDLRLVLAHCAPYLFCNCPSPISDVGGNRETSGPGAFPVSASDTRYPQDNRKLFLTNGDEMKRMKEMGVGLPRENPSTTLLHPLQNYITNSPGIGPGPPG